MSTKPTDSNSSVEKEGIHYSTTGRTTRHHLHPAYNPRAPLTDEVHALARRVFLKFDLILVLPMLIMFCECDTDYKRQLTLLYVSKIYCHSLTG